MTASSVIRRGLAALALGAAALGMPAARPAAAQAWRGPYEQFYLPARHNWTFRNSYAAADRLFNAFDYGHAILYELLYTRPDAPASRLEEREYDFITKRLLVRPPRLPLEERAIEVEYAKLVPEAQLMFEWAHVLHRQLYDVLADERLTPERKDAEVARLLAYYRTRPDLAFSARPKSMKLMQEQPYSLAFRQKYPKFNGLIWAYHWMQVGLYEPLLVGTTSDQRQAGVRATVGRFWQMLRDPPRTLPYQMPMTAAVSPTFAARYPEAAIVFDNLHSMHDVVSDILANPAVPRHAKRAEILLAARRFRDDTSYVMPVEAWRAMAHHMGVENMGGPAVGFVDSLPRPTVTMGAVMQHDDRTGEMTGFASGNATQTGASHHGAPAPTAAGAGDSSHTQTHSAHGEVVAADSAAASGEAAGLAMRLLADPVIRRRALSDTALRRTLVELVERAPAEHREHLRALTADTADSAAADSAGAASSGGRRGQSGAARPPSRRPARTTAKPAPKPATPPPADPHAGHHPPPKPPATRQP